MTNIQLEKFWFQGKLDQAHFTLLLPLSAAINPCQNEWKDSHLRNLGGKLRSTLEKTGMWSTAKAAVGLPFPTHPPVSPPGQSTSLISLLILAFLFINVLDIKTDFFLESRMYFLRVCSICLYFHENT